MKSGETENTVIMSERFFKDFAETRIEIFNANQLTTDC